MSKNNGNTLFEGARLMMLASLLTPVAMSVQDAQAADQGSLEEIIVTASKRDERLVDVPMSVSALRGQDLVTRNLLQIEDFASQVPGLVVEQATNRATRIVLRGLNSGGAGATVATVIDEATLSYSSSTSNGAIDIANLDTYDLNRIEVLRGPQGTLYGAAAEGGLVKYVTNAPKLDEFEGDAEAGVESIEQGGTGFTGRGMLNLPMGNGTAAVRVTGFYKDIAGFIDNPLMGRKDANDGERYGGRAQLLVQPSDNFSIRLMALMQDQDYNDPGYVELVGAAFTPGTRTPNEFDIANDGKLLWNTINPGTSNNQLRLYSAVMDWSTSAVNILSATSYGEVNSTFHSDLTYGEGAPGVTNEQIFSPLFGGGPIAIYGNQDNDLAKFNQELRFSSPDPIELGGAGGLGLDWQFGAFYSDEDITFNQFFDVLDPVTGAILLSDAFAPFGVPQLPAGGSELPASYKELSGFGEVVVHFNDRFDVALGGRYSRNKQESQVTNFAGVITSPFDTINPRVKSDESQFTWSVAPSYHFTDNGMFYTRVASGYRPGGPSLAIPGAPPDFPLSYSSDSTVNYELGIKGDLANGVLSYDVAAFYIDWTDIQVLSEFVSTTSGQRYTITGNAGKARSQGIEWNFAWEPVDGLVVSDTGAYVNAELTETAASLGGLKGDQLPYVPEWTNTLNVDYRTDVAGIPVSMGGTWSYIGERFTSFGAPLAPTDVRRPGSHVALDSYSTFSLQVGATFDRFRVNAFVRNLTDERALAYYGTGGGFNFTGSGQIIQPRTYGVSVGVSF